MKALGSFTFSLMVDLKKKEAYYLFLFPFLLPFEPVSLFSDGIDSFPK